MSTAPLNKIVLKSGRERAVCEYCGRQSASLERASIAFIAVGWSMTPYPADYVHSFDGSVGSLFSCPSCNKNPVGRRPLLTRGLTGENE